MRSAELLTKYLVELDRRGWDCDEFVRQHPEMSVALRHMLRVADRVRHSPAPAPSEAFRQRSRRRLAAVMTRPPARRRWYRLGTTWSPYRPLIAPVAAGLLIVFGLGGVWSASAAALPHSLLYPAKLAIERAELITAISPDRRAEVHLAIAHERLLEAAREQEQGDLVTAQVLIQGSDAEVAQAQAVVRTDYPHTAVATAVASTVAQVNDERKQIATRVVAVPIATQLPEAHTNPNQRAAGPYPGNTASSAPTQAGTDSVVQSESPDSDDRPNGNQDNHQPPGKAYSHDSPPQRVAGSGDDNPPGRGDGGSSASVAMDARVASRNFSAPPPDGTDSPTDQANQLIHTLVAQASRGDPSTQQTAARYLALIRSQRSGDSDWRTMLADHRALVEKAIPAAPPSTRPVLQSILQELNRAITPSDAGQDPRTGSATSRGADLDSARAFAFASSPRQSPGGGKSRPGAQWQDSEPSAFTPSSDSRSALAVLQKIRTPGPSSSPDRPTNR